MVGRERQDDLGRASDELESGLLRLDRSEEAQQVGEHDTVGELGAVIKSIDLTAVLGQSSEGEDVVEIHAESFLLVVDVVDESFDVLLRSLVEGDDGEARALGSALLVDGLIVLDAVRMSRSQRTGLKIGPVNDSRGAGVARGGDDDLGSSGEETLNNLDSDGSLTDTGHEGVLVLEGHSRGGDLLEDVEIERAAAGKVASQRSSDHE